MKTDPIMLALYFAYGIITLPNVDKETDPGVDLLRQLGFSTEDNDPVKQDKGELGPPDGWPKKVWLLEYSNGLHGSFCYQGQHGLAAFKVEANCWKWASYVLNPPNCTYKPVKKTFDEARALAKQKAEATAGTPKPIRALILADSGPLVLFVV